MPTFRIADAARLLGVSEDTMRRWADSDHFTKTVDPSGRRVIEGAELASFAVDHAAATPQLVPNLGLESARNRFVGIVTRVLRDAVMAQVDIQSGANRIVSLMSREAADELGLEPGVLAVASVKSTNVVIEIPHAI